MQQLSFGVIEKVHNYENGKTHYLPHRPDIRDDKESTKLRIVFDASCESYIGGKSLNDVLFPGPSLTELLGDVLLRFRSCNYVFAAENEKTFLQIGITPEYRDFIRFLWFERPAFLLNNREQWPNYKPVEKFLDEEEGSTHITSTEAETVSFDSIFRFPTILEQSEHILLVNDVNPTIPGVCSGKNDPPPFLILQYKGVSNAIDIERYSKLKKLLRVTARVIQFKDKIWKKMKNKEKENIEINNSKINKNEKMKFEELTGENINAAKKLWIKNVQNSLVKSSKFELWCCDGRC